MRTTSSVPNPSMHVLAAGTGGFGGPTHTLTFDPAKDVLRYDQAVTPQRYDIHFDSSARSADVDGV